MTANLFHSTLAEHLAVFNILPTLAPDVASALNIMRDALRAGNKIIVAGNGGSAADAQHFAAELVGRFLINRRALPCISLTTDTSNLTAIGNDFGFDAVFARQVEALGKKGDVFLGISTSGNSANIMKAVSAAKAANLTTLGLLGNDGGTLYNMVDSAVRVPHPVTARIQEAHIFILHHWAEVLEKECA